MIIDAHQHFWDRSCTQFDHSWQESEKLEPICRSFLPSDLQPILDDTGVDKTVFVQTQHQLDENRWALNLARENDFIAGIVGWVDLTAEDCQAQLDEFLDDVRFVGIRHVVQDEPDDDFVVRPEFLRGLKILEQNSVPYDLLFFARHLRHAATVADQLPNLKLVIDHLSKPEIESGDINRWSRELREAAKRPNVWCKLSGLVTEADWKRWSIDDLRPYFDVALDAFGPRRLMYGSDWPVCLLAASYEQVLSTAKQLIAQLSEHEQAAILGQTAIDFYSLKLTGTGQHARHPV